MKINLHLNKKLFSDKFFPYLKDWSTRWFVLMGGAGSGKSYFCAQKIIVRCVSEPIRVAVCRRYQTTLRNSCFALFKDVLKKWKLTSYVKIKESDMSISFPNGSQIIMLGLDDEEKLLSLHDVSVIWIEEAFEVEANKIEQLDLRMRGKAKHQQLILSFNPISKKSYLYDFCEVHPPESFTYIISTYKDNPFLGDEYVRAIEEMKTRNPARYKVYGLAQYGVDTEGLVFSNWKIEDFDALGLSSTLEHRAGMDLGYHDPSAVMDTLYDREHHIIYVFNEFYKSGCQLSELSSAIADMKLTKTRLYVDSAEPRTIQYLRNEGINAIGAQKGKDSVKAGISFLQDNQIVIHPSCEHLIDEFENFSYIKDKRSGEWTDDTTHEFSHGVDALRYGYSDIYTNRKLKTIDKKLLSI